MKKASFIIIISLVALFHLPCLAEDLEYGRIVGDRKYFVENPATGGGRDYIVKNPRATLPQPNDIPLAKMSRRPQTGARLSPPA